LVALAAEFFLSAGRLSWRDLARNLVFLFPLEPPSENGFLRSDISHCPFPAITGDLLDALPPFAFLFFLPAPSLASSFSNIPADVLIAEYRGPSVNMAFA